MRKNSVFKRGLSWLVTISLIAGLATFPVGAAGTTYYVSPTGDDAADGLTVDSPLLNIKTAYDKAESGDTIEITDDMDLTMPVGEFNDNKDITITSSDANTITYTGTDSIDVTSSGLFKVNSGKVTFRSVNINMNMANKALSGRALFAGQDATVYVEDCDFVGGAYVDGVQGGASIYVHSGAEVYLKGVTSIANNVSAKAGGGVFVADGGTLGISDEAILNDNSAAEGGAVYVSSGAVLLMSGSAKVFGNTATVAGGGLFLAQGSSSQVSGDVQIKNNEVSNKLNNVYLQNLDSNPVTVDTTKVATLDASGVTSGARIGITCQNPNYYRLVSLPAGHYDITKADEAGWTYDDGTYDIRLMTREGVTGLFLYYFTIPVTYNGTENLYPESGIQGEDINGEIINYPSEIATEDDMENNTPLAGEYVMNVSVDDSKYRIPETIVLSTEAREWEEGTDYEWEPDYANGTGKITIYPVPLMEAHQLGNTLNVAVAADQYFTLTLNLSDVDIDLKGFFENADDTTDVTDAEITDKGYTVQYVSSTNPTKGTVIDSETNAPVDEPLTVSLYEYASGSSNLVGTVDTVDGVYDFNTAYTLDASKSYYITFDYSRANRVISKGYIEADITAFPGHTIPNEARVISGGIDASDIQYTVDAASNTAKLIIPRNTIKADTVIAIGTKETGHTVYFDANGGTCTVTSKPIVEGVSAYGKLPDDTQTTRMGYTFLGWFTEQVGGKQITAESVFDSTTDVTLYAHWSPNGDRQYKIEQWVEFLPDGVNVGYEEHVTNTTTFGEKTYYLYQTDTYHNGVADADDMDISGLTMSEMTSTEYDWWTINGFTVNKNSQLTNLHVNPDGSSIYQIYYDRNTYKVTLDAGDNGEVTGKTPTITSPTDDVYVEIPFGDTMKNPSRFDYGSDTLVKPVLPGYEFDGWYDGDEKLVTPDTIYTKADDSTLHAHWTACDDTVYVVHFMLQNVGLNPVSNRIEAKKGEYVDCAVAVSVKHDAEGNYVGLEVRDYYLSDGTTKVECYFGQGTTEDDVVLTEIPQLTGFNYAGFKNSVGTEGSKADKPTVHIEPNDAALKNDLTSDTLDVEALEYSGKLGELFLYYDRVVNEVQFDAGNGNLPDKTTGDIPYGGDFQNQFPDDPNRPGYDFSGWVDKDGNPVTEKTPTDQYTKVDGTVTLYPTWTARQYNLTYVIAPSAEDGHSASTFVPGEGGVASVVPSVENGYSDGRYVVYDAAIGTMPTNNKVGYTFQGWYLSLDPLTDKISSDTILSIDNVVIEDTQTPNGYENTRPLYAYVTPNTYQITFNGGQSIGGVAATVPVTQKDVVFDAPYGQPSKLPVPTLTGYTFQGWYLDPNNPDTLVDNDTIYTLPQNVVLYAKWTPNQYRYTFVLNDSVDPEGKGSTPATLTSNGISYDDPAVDETFDHVYSNVFEFEASRVGYVFDGWALTRNGTPLTKEQIVSIAADATLYACWTPKTYDVVLNHNDGFVTGAADVTNVLPDALTFDAVYKLSDIVTDAMTPTLADYAFKGWSTVRNDKTTIVTDANWIASQQYVTDANLTLYAAWAAIIKVNPDGGTFAPGSSEPFTPGSSTPVDVDTDELVKLPDVTKPGYTHDGWKDENGNRVTEDTLKQDNKPAVITPVFKANVSFNANGGKVNGVEIYTVKAESVTVLPTGVRSSYDFNGWYTEATGGVRVTLTEIQALTAPMTVYAHWTERHTGGGGGGGGGGGSVREYDVDVVDTAHGKTTSDKYEASSGEKVTITAKPDGSYKIDTISVTTTKGKNVDYTETKTGFWFRMPASDVVVKVTYKNLVGDILNTGDHRDYIHGYTDGLVRPNNNMTRGEAAQMFYNLLLNKDVTASGGKKFSDVPSNMWCAEAIRVTSALGIVAGYTDGTFRPDNHITRAQFATMCVRFLDSTGSDENGYSNVFKDVTPGAWYYDYVMTAAEHDWVNGYGNGYFGPNDKITRAQVMTLMNHMLGREADEEYVDAHMSDIHYFPDLRDPSVWYFYDVVEATTSHDYNTYASGEDWTYIR